MNSYVRPGFWRCLVGVLLLSVAVSVGLYGFFMSLENDTDDNSKALFSQDSVYLDECGACHMAYPPGLLPAASWRLMLEHLDDHFGDNAELPEVQRDYISEYLQREALQYGKPTTMSRMLRNLPNEPFIRITELPNFILDHQDLAADIGGKSADEGFFSDCEACHTEAVQGRFAEPKVPEIWRLDRDSHLNQEASNQ